MILSIVVSVFLSVSTLHAGKINTCPGSNSMGTVLFTASDVTKQCWSPDEIAIVTARMLMEDILPEINILYIDSDEFVEDLVAYFKMLINSVRKESNGRKKHILLLALTDLIGGYLQHAVLPIARQAFYSGLIDFSNMEILIELFEEMKWYLHTNGQGWAKPIMDSPTFEADVIDLKTETPITKANKSCCSKLIYYEHELSKKLCLKSGIPQVSVHFPMPFFDSAIMPSAIAIPFRKFPVRNIESRKASYILLKFFILASQCLLDRHANPQSIKKFQDLFYSWIEQEVLPKLSDDKLYSAFGGILRVHETLKSLGAEATALRDVPSATQSCEEEAIISPEAKPAAKRSLAVIIAMIFIISLWFIIGTGFVCYRMRRNQSQGDDKCVCANNYPNTSSSSGWSMLTKSSSKSASCKSSCGKCISSEKSTDVTTGSASSEGDSKNLNRSKKALTVCYPPRKAPFMVENDDRPAIIEAKQAMKMLPSIAEMSEHSSYAKDDTTNTRKYEQNSSLVFGEPLATSSKENITNNNKKLTFSMGDDMKLMVKPCPKYVDTSKSRSFTKKLFSKSKKQYDDCYCRKEASRGQNLGNSFESSKRSPSDRSMDDTTDNTEVSAKSPRAFACHSSLTGDHTKDFQVPGDKPYVFGYDFHTSSSSDLSEDEDMKTSTSKMSER